MEFDPTISASTSRSDALAKCQVCCQPSHGRHFGAETCRACAAFFRRYNVPRGPGKFVRVLRCRMKNNDCRPHGNGKWYCKKCRLERCNSLGMKPDNIQLDRDSHSSTKGKEKTRSPRRPVESVHETVPTNLERSCSVAVLENINISASRRSYVDLTDLAGVVSNILNTSPILDRKTRQMSTLEKLSFGLSQIRRTQLLENIRPLERIGKDETVRMWEQEVTKAAKWLMYCDEFRSLSHDDKFTVVKCMWHLFNRLERIAMTAKMRRQNLCSSQQFVLSHTQIIDYKAIKIDVGWLTDLPVDKLTFFLGPISTWFNDQQVNDFIELQPTDMELTFMLCNLCFQLTGKEFNGPIEEYTEKLQEVLANDLHMYYLKTDRKNRYSHRLVKLLNINKDYQNFMLRRRESAEVGSVLNAFKINFSHPEMFTFSC